MADWGRLGFLLGVQERELGTVLCQWAFVSTAVRDAIVMLSRTATHQK